MCGIAGVYAGASQQAPAAIYECLNRLQHRGQDAAGLAFSTDRGIKKHIGNGLVEEVLPKALDLSKTASTLAIGHVRYPTSGGLAVRAAQPLFDSENGIALVHNGQLVNIAAIREYLAEAGIDSSDIQVDSELLLLLLACEFSKAKAETSDVVDAAFDACSAVFSLVVGAYSAVCIIQGVGLLAFRDAHGIRPLSWAKRHDRASGTSEYAFASESCALPADFRNIANVAPGTAMLVDLQGSCHVKPVSKAKSTLHCAFEWVYLARPDAVIDHRNVLKVRRRMGAELAEQIAASLAERDKPDIVVPIPDCSTDIGMELGARLGISVVGAVVRNRYVGRTFIMNGQQKREANVSRKHSVVGDCIKGRHVLLVDDSIVRGTTSRRVIRMVREAGAAKVSFASAAPPIIAPNIYGIDLPEASDLIASGRSIEEIKEYMGADNLVYLDFDRFLRALSRCGKVAADDLELSVFTGKHSVQGIDPALLETWGRSRQLLAD